VRDFYGFLLVSQVETVDSVYKLEKEVWILSYQIY
jgi:hypothetical protein